MQQLSEARRLILANAPPGRLNESHRAWLDTAAVAVARLMAEQPDHYLLSAWAAPGWADRSASELMTETLETLEVFDLEREAAAAPYVEALRAAIPDLIRDTLALVSCGGKGHALQRIERAAMELERHARQARAALEGRTG